MALPASNLDREHRKFVESPTRPDNSAVEVVIGGGSVTTIDVIKNQILDAIDRTDTFNYTDVGTKKRLDSIEYNSPSISALTLSQTFTWLDFGTKNERISLIEWDLT